MKLGYQTNTYILYLDWWILHMSNKWLVIFLSVSVYITWGHMWLVDVEHFKQKAKLEVWLVEFWIGWTRIHMALLASGSMILTAMSVVGVMCIMVFNKTLWCHTHIQPFSQVWAASGTNWRQHMGFLVFWKLGLCQICLAMASGSDLMKSSLMNDSVIVEWQPQREIK